MILNYFFICTGFFGIITLIKLIVYYKKNKLVNIHLLLLLFFFSLNFILISLKVLFNPLNTLLNSAIYGYLFVFNALLLYLYIKNIEENIKIISKNDTQHFSLLFAIIIGASYFSSTPINISLFKILFILISLYYYYKIFNLLKKRIYNRKYKLKLISIESEVINKWGVFVFLLSILNLIQIILLFDFDRATQLNDLISNCFEAAVFNAALIKISFSPEIVYGYKSKTIPTIKIENFNLEFGDLWIKIPSKKITNSPDIILFENIKGSIHIYSNKIDNLIIETKIIRNSDITLTEISKMLEIPKSHLTYLFKYHCNINFAEYKNSARVYDSFNLIKDGFLKTNTLEALSIKVGFSSYNPFYIAFKKISGTTPQLFSKNYI